MENQELKNFIIEARKRGFDDGQIKQVLLNHSWPSDLVNHTFIQLNNLKRLNSNKNKIEIYLSDEIYNVLQKRAKKNMMTLSEMVEDILRRSAINANNLKKEEDKLDDMLLKIFSRKNTGPKKKR